MASERCATPVHSHTFPFCGLFPSNGVTGRLLLTLALLTCKVSAANGSHTLQSFGVRVEQGRIVYPLPSNVALGLFNPDPLLDVAYFADGKVQVYQNMGNGLFEFVSERNTSGDVRGMEWTNSRGMARGMVDHTTWGDLVIGYVDGRSETYGHEQILAGKSDPARGFGSLPGMDPPLNFHKVWQSPVNGGISREVGVGDIDNDGKIELAYWLYPPAGSGDTTSHLFIYECAGPDSFVVDWDTVTYDTYGGPFAVTDIDNDGHKEIVTAYFPHGYPSLSLLECLGPRQYRYYRTNIGFDRDLYAAMETDVNHDGVKELTVLTSNPSAISDPTLIYIAEFTGKARLPNGDWLMSFNGQIARYGAYAFNVAVGQVDGEGRDEIIPAGGSFGVNEPAPIDYLWYSGIPGPNLWQTRELYTGLRSGTGAVMFVNLDADTTMEFVSGAPGPIGHGSMFALKYQHDTTWSVMWADSSLLSSPLSVNGGWLDGQCVVAGANTFWPTNDFLWSELHVYQPGGSPVAIWHRDSLSIQDFYFSDLDDDGKTDLVFAQLSHLLRHRLVIYESDSTTTSILPHGDFPVWYELSQNYPNPFNPTTKILFSMPRRGWIDLRVYDVLGNEVKTLVSESMSAGVHETFWNSTTNKGGDAASGAYFYRMIVREGEERLHTVTKKMVLIR